MHEDVPDLDDSALPDGRAEMFRNRLRKNLRRLLPWAARRDIEAYRLYDSDIPEVRLIVERYGSHILLSEYARRADAEPEMFDRRERFLADVTETLVKECGVSRDDIFIKHRHR